jgi:hypothetical protein
MAYIICYTDLYYRHEKEKIEYNLQHHLDYTYIDIYYNNNYWSNWQTEQNKIIRQA